MNRYKIIILLNLIFLIVYINWSILKKEKTLAEGTLMLFELAPVDPRSIMQGDFMWLNYQIANEARRDTSLSRFGYCVVNLDEYKIAQKVRFQKDVQPLNADEMIIKYSMKTRGLSIGADSYFFEEGSREKFQPAKYGGLRVDKNGNSILVGLYDEDKRFIEKK